jgi:hypothetical protein
VGFFFGAGRMAMDTAGRDIPQGEIASRHAGPAPHEPCLFAICSIDLAGYDAGLGKRACGLPGGLPMKTFRMSSRRTVCDCCYGPDSIIR